MTSFLDLPNEIIIDILSNADISLTEIYILSCLSKRLNNLALPLYLAAHGIPDPEQEISINVLDWDLHPQNTRLKSCRPDTLAGLNVSTNISQVKHFKCFFQRPNGSNSSQQPYNLSLAVKRTARFIDRLKHLEIAELYLVWDSYYVRSNKAIPHVPIPALNEWTESFCALLNLIVERGCTSLTVQYGASVEPAFRFRSSNPITKTFSNVFQKRRDHQARNINLHWELDRPLHEGKLDHSSVSTAHLSRRAQESNSIVTLSLHSTALLLPPCVDWTLSLLYSHSNLTCITFAHLTFPDAVWTTLLPLIADAVSDRLTKLSFFLQCTNLTGENLIRFLGRLPHLTHLSVDRLLWSRFQFSRTKGKSQLFNLTPPYLPQLQILQAPPELVSILLNAQPPSSPSRKNEASTGLPQLRSLILYPCSLLQYPTNYSESTSVINTLIAQIKNRSRSHEVEYTLDLQTDFTNFVNMTQYLQSQASEQKTYHSRWDEINRVEVEQLASRQYGSRLVFHDITRVVMYPHYDPTSLCPWLSLLFPHLKTLVFTCRITAQPKLGSLLDSEVAEELIKELIKELPVVCPTVRSFVVADQTYELGGD